MPKPKGPRPKHTPRRTCVVCRSERSKRELVRIVRLATPETTGATTMVAQTHAVTMVAQSAPSIQVDPTGKVAGRGAYLCRTGSCWDSPGLAQKLNAALKTTLTAEDLATLRSYRATIED